MSQAYPLSSSDTVMDNDTIMNENNDTGLNGSGGNHADGELEPSASIHLLIILCRRQCHETE